MTYQSTERNDKNVSANENFKPSGRIFVQQEKPVKVRHTHEFAVTIEYIEMKSLDGIERPTRLMIRRIKATGPPLRCDQQSQKNSDDVQTIWY